MAGLFLLAGCAQPPDNEQEPSSGSDTEIPACDANCTIETVVLPDQPIKRIDFLDCDSYFLQYAVDEAKVQALLPSGYSAAPLAGNIGTLSLDAFNCGQVAVGNLSAHANVQFYAVSGLVEAPANRSADFNDLYLFELVFSEQTLVDAFVAQGLPAELGTFTAAEMGQVFQTSYTGSQGQSYEYSGAGLVREASNTAVSTSSVRFHDAGLFCDMHSTGIPPSFGEAGSLSVQGGAIERTKLHPGPITGAHSGVSTYTTITFEFGGPTA